MPGRPLVAEHSGDTSYFCVVDGDGKAVSFIHSLSAGFGSGVVAGDTGITLNNRAGRGFSLQEGHPNVVAPGKRTMHTLNAYMCLRDGGAWLVGGTPGGDQQTQVNTQIVTTMVDQGLSVREAVEAPRWFSFPGTDPATIDQQHGDPDRGPGTRGHPPASSRRAATCWRCSGRGAAAARSS